MTRVRRFRHDLVSTRLPSATIRSPLMASVAAAGRRGSSVRMRPLTRSVSAAIPLPISFVEQTYHEHCSCEKCYLRQKTTTFCRGENSCIRPEIVLNDASVTQSPPRKENVAPRVHPVWSGVNRTVALQPLTRWSHYSCASL